MTARRPETYTDKMTKEQELEQANDRKLDTFANYQKARVQAAGKDLPSPIIKQEDGTLRWLNRKERRKAKIK